MSNRHPFDTAIFDLYRDRPAAPNPGFTYQIPMPDNCRFQLQTLWVRLVTNAGLSTRLLYLFINDGATIIQFAYPRRSQALNSTLDYYFSAGSQFWPAPAVIDPFNWQGLGHEIILAPPATLQIGVLAMDAGDQLSNLSYSLKIWRDVPQLL